MVLVAVLLATPQSQPNKPECAKGAICFTGEVRQGETFRKPLTVNLEITLQLQPNSAPSEQRALWITGSKLTRSPGHGTIERMNLTAEIALADSK